MEEKNLLVIEFINGECSEFELICKNSFSVENGFLCIDKADGEYSYINLIKIGGFATMTKQYSIVE